MREFSSASISRAALCAVAVSACASTVPHPTQFDVTRARATRPTLTLEQLVTGRALYVNKCGGCHALFAPRAFSAERWPAEVDEMARRVTLQARDRDLIVGYLTAMSSAASR